MRTSGPWLRGSTGTWHVRFNGKQRYLVGKDEEKAREKFHRMTQSGIAGDRPYAKSYKPIGNR